MLKIKLLIIYLLLVISQAVAQVTSPNATYNNVDITTVNVDNLSDAQIKNYWDRAQAQGYSLDQFIALARSRGMQETQVMKLRQRIMQLGTSSDIKNKLKENTKTGRRPAEGDDIFGYTGKENKDSINYQDRKSVV